jgi:hypothetical protein
LNPSVCHALELRGNYVTYSKSENIVGKLDSSATTYVKVIIVVRALHPQNWNRLHVSTVEALLHIRYGLIRRGKTCVTFTPSDDMLANFNSSDASTSQHAPDDDAAFISITDNV